MQKDPTGATILRGVPRSYSRDILRSVLPTIIRQPLGIVHRWALRNTRYSLSRLGAGLSPNFIIIGVQRGGTTSLFDWLATIPQIIFPIYKEVHFFDNQWPANLHTYNSFFPTKLAPHIAALTARGVKYSVGESSPYYMFHPDLPRRLVELLPDVKLIACLRNPIDRAYSHYHHERNMKREPFETFEDAITHEDARLTGEEERMLHDITYKSYAHWRFGYLGPGIYHRQITNWLNFFPRDKFMFIKSEKMYKDPEATVNDTLKFLGLEPNWKYDRDRFYIDSAYAPEPIAANTRKRLNEYFQPHNKALATLIGDEFNWPE